MNMHVRVKLESYPVTEWVDAPESFVEAVGKDVPLLINLPYIASDERTGLNILVEFRQVGQE